MKANKQFKKHYSRLRREAFTVSALFGGAIGLAVGFITSAALWFTKINGLYISIAAFIAVSVVSSLIFYFGKYRPTLKSGAKRIDSLGLEERLITMVELSDDKSYIAELQRRDARAALEKVAPSRLKVRVPKAAVILPTVALVLFAGMTVVTVLGMAGLLPEGSELLEEMIEESREVYVSVTYEAEDGGYIDGEADQLILLGTNPESVVAVAEEGYVFVEWDDGYDRPGRSDTKVTEDVVYIAVFEPIAEEGDGGDDGTPDDNPENPENESQDSQGNPDDSESPPSQAGGKYEEANQIIDGKTYYREVLEMYKDLLRERLETEGDKLSEEERAIIEAYLGIV